MSERTMPKKRQKTYSLPFPIVEYVHNLYEENMESWSRAGITNETQLLVALIKNGQPHMEELLDFLRKQKRERKDYHPDSSQKRDS